MNSHKTHTAGELIRQGGGILFRNNVVDGLPEALFEAEILMSHALKAGRASIWSKREEIFLTEAAFKEYMGSIEKRSRQVPVAYITEEAEFMGMKFKVDGNVLIPRPETELLAEKAIEIIKKYITEKKGAGVVKVVEPCTGSGNLAVSVAKFLSKDHRGKFSIYSSDISPEAVRIAVENAEINGVAGFVKAVTGDMYAPFEKMRFKHSVDFIISNPPYIRTAEMDSLEKDLKFEPRIALCGGRDGLDFYRKILKRAPEFLKTGGWLIVEIGCEQGAGVKRMIGSTAGMRFKAIFKDLSHNDRVIAAVKQ